MTFKSRKQAGRKLARRLAPFALGEPIVLALPRGGVPIGFEIARHLKVALDVLIVKKIPVPGNPEFGMGAITEDGEGFIDTAITQYLQIPDEEVKSLALREYDEVKRRILHYRKGKALPELRDRTVILADDGLATGVTIRAAVQFLRAQGVNRLILAIPVCASEAVEKIKPEVDELVCLHQPEGFHSVSESYEDFPQLSDEEVLRLLHLASPRMRESASPTSVRPGLRQSSEPVNETNDVRLTRLRR